MQLFGLLGFPLGHSFSKTYFTEKFKTEKIDAEFVNFESDNIEQTLQVIKTTPSLKGFAVTIPYKRIAPVNLLEGIRENVFFNIKSNPVYQFGICNFPGPDFVE